MPLTKDDRKQYPKVALRGWKNGETKDFLFLDEGVDYTGEYGLVYVYHVKHEKEDRTLWIKPRSPLAIGLQAIVNIKPLQGCQISISKTTGAENKDTRYTAVEI